MAQLRQDYAEFVERGAQVVVIGPEDASAFPGLLAARGLPFIGLPDPTHSVLEAVRAGGQPVQAGTDAGPGDR